MYSRYDIMGTCKSTSLYKRYPEADRRLIVQIRLIVIRDADIIVLVIM